MGQSFSMRKIPTDSKILNDIDTEVGIDKIKILELCNSIDAWEKEVLFSENGFFSLTGKQVEGKTKEFIFELEKFVNAQISKMSFKSVSTIEIVKNIKFKKVQSVQQQMLIYEQEQLDSWVLDVYEKALQCCIQRALLYKNVPEIITSAYKNGLLILKAMADKENWNAKIHNLKKDNFSSSFYFQLINEFILDKDVKASLYFEKYAEKIIENDRKKLETSLKDFKDNVVAYNWAKELISYELSDDENDGEINKVNDEKIKPLIKHFVSIFKEQKNKQKKQEEKDKNENNWNEIIQKLSSEPDKAELYIDSSLSLEMQQAKKAYIKAFRKKGYIETDKKKFFDLLKKIKDNFDEFKQNSISNYRSFLSQDDFEMIQQISAFSGEKYSFFISDYDYISSKLKEKNISNLDDIYNLVKFLFSFQTNYLKNEQKEPDIEKRNKLINAAIERYSQSTCEHK